MPVKNFEYNGLFITVFDGYTSYTAEFKEWTDDPGVAVCVCSDGYERLIPVCVLDDFDYNSYPKQKKTGLIWGIPSHS